jgi:hypothetical protein
MSREKWTIQYRDKAADEIGAVIKQNPDLKALILLRLRELEDFPPIRWFKIIQHNGVEIFTADNQMVHISGEADPNTLTVWINKVSIMRKPRKGEK